MENIKISIIVPVFNIEKYVEKAVQSIQQQTYQNLEIVLVDDGSSDDSSKIIDEIARKDQRVKVIHKSNGGVTRARMDGIKIASGEWIGFVDGDDFIEPNMFEKLLNNALEYHADISHCGYQMVFPSRIDYYYNTGRLVQQDNLAGIRDLLDGSFVEPGLWNKLFHKSLFHGLLHDDLIDNSIKINEDLLMNYYLFKSANNSVYQDFCPYHYIVRVGSAANSLLNEHHLKDPLKVLKQIDIDTKNNEAINSIVFRRLALVYIQGAAMKNNDNQIFIKNHIKECKRELKKIRTDLLQGPFSRHIKLMCLLCVVSPSLYRLIHKCYSKAKGTDKKYEVS